MENRIDEFNSLVRCLYPRLARHINRHTNITSAKAFRRNVANVYLRRNQVDVLGELLEHIEVEDWAQFTRADQAEYRNVLNDQVGVCGIEMLRQAAFKSVNSAKLERVLDLTREAIDEGRKVVIFSRYLEVLGRIRNDLADVVVGTLVGNVPANQRQEMVDEFNLCDKPVVLLSQIDTGGVGSNLQTASVAIITKPQWKPSAEDQAMARLQRMGQTNIVHVHRVFATSSIDELLLQVQDRKRLLFNEFVWHSDAKSADLRSVDTTEYPAILNDQSIPIKHRIVLAEQYRMLGHRLKY